MEENFKLVSEHWQEVLETVQEECEMSHVSFKAWLEPLEIVSVDNSRIVLSVPTGSSAINILNKKYTLPLRVAIEEMTGLSLDIHYVLPGEEKEPVQKSVFTQAMEDAHLNSKYTFDTFVVGQSNKFAHAASLAVAESPGDIYNPLYLYSSAGLGKTHLMHSIAHFILEKNPETKILYVTSEDFTNELIDSLRSSNTSVMSDFREKYRNIDVLLMDDIQFIIGKDRTQEEFFHTFEALYRANKQIIISSDKPPREITHLEERITSRMEMGLLADIDKPDYETRVAILRKKEDLDGFHVDDSIIDYIARNIKTNIRELEGCLNRIRAKSILEKRSIDLPLAQEILNDIISPDQNRQITSTIIIETVAAHFNLTVKEMCSQKRDNRVVHPRMIAMYLCRTMTEDALKTIASLVNKKDHTTVMSAVHKIEQEIETNPETKSQIEVIQKKLSGCG
ncbi:MAG: chromosomal replication initiator protein DnaA [Lachnospiraceae bacterium]|nr:chromosomal replication initiator protein DnaA [Candidatus Equihabitans merdae]